MAADAAAAAFPAWLAARGVDASAVRCSVEFARSGRGLGAASAGTRAGSAVVRVPEALLLTRPRCANALRPWLATALPHLLDDAGGHDELVLALFLLREAGRGAASEWGPYVMSLPPASTYACVLSQWTPEQLDWLDDAAAAAAATERRASLARDLDAVLAALEAVLPAAASAGSGPESLPVAAAATMAGDVAHGLGLARGRDAALGAFTWARLTVQSRAMLNGLDDGGGVNGGCDDPFSDAYTGGGVDGSGAPGAVSLAVVPLVDMCNHVGSSEAVTVTGDGETAVLCDVDWEPAPAGGSGGSVVLRAPVAVPPGAELAISYGDRTGRDLLETYGFVLPLADNAPGEAVPLELGWTGLAVAGSSSDAAAATASVTTAQPLPAGVRDSAISASPPVLAARGRLFSLLGAPESIDLDATGADAAAVCDPASPAWLATPCQPRADSLALLRALVVDADDAAALGVWSLSSARPEHFARPFSRDNELASLRLLHWLLMRADGVDPGAATDAAPQNSLTLPGADALARALTRQLAADRFTLALLAARTKGSPAASTGDGYYSGTADAARLRFGAAAMYRHNRRALLLRHVLYVARMYAVAEGQPDAGNATATHAAAALAAVDASIAVATAAVATGGQPLAWGLEVQPPWAEMLLDGRKAVETRAYPLPAQLLPPATDSAGAATPLVPVALIRSPPGGLAAHGLAAGEVIGIVAFVGCKRYATQQQWDADAGGHCVPDGHPDFGWRDGGGDRYGWLVAPPPGAPAPIALPAPVPIALTEAQRLHRSVFRLVL